MEFDEFKKHIDDLVKGETFIMEAVVNTKFENEAERKKAIEENLYGFAGLLMKRYIQFKKRNE